MAGSRTTPEKNLDRGVVDWRNRYPLAAGPNPILLLTPKRNDRADVRAFTLQLPDSTSGECITRPIQLSTRQTQGRLGYPSPRSDGMLKCSVFASAPLARMLSMAS